jgi:hypothetical protein
MAMTVLGGCVTPATAITGVLTRLWHVPPGELTHIAVSDRAYVASEMTAFLTAFLSDLPCAVLNRPSASGLSGPGWRREQWVRAAARVGIPVAPVQRIARHGEPAATAPAIASEVTVVGELAFGADDPDLVRWSRELAATAGVDLLGAQFTRHGRGYAFAGVNPWPILSYPGAFDAVRELLMKRP